MSVLSAFSSGTALLTPVQGSRGHLKGDAEVMKKNNKANTAAKRAALEPVTWQQPLIPQRPDPSNYSPTYTKGRV